MPLKAYNLSEIRDALPVWLGSAEIRSRIAAEVRANAIFSARTGNAIYLSKLKEVIDAVTAGNIDQATARVTLMQTLRAIGYTPEGGFSDAPEGAVPPALKETLQDLSSKRRLDLIIETQRSLMIGRSQQFRGMEPARLQQFPAWELVRVEPREITRRWGGRESGADRYRRPDMDPRSRWTIAGGVIRSGKMIALKGDPVWGELGSSENFSDALDTDHPPFAFRSGMGWREVSAGEARVLEVTGPNGESVDFWITEPHPLLTGTQPALPVPQIAISKMDPEIARALEKKADALVVDGTAYPKSADSKELRDRIAARRAAREARREELARQAGDQASAAYAKKEGNH